MSEHLFKTTIEVWSKTSSPSVIKDLSSTSEIYLGNVETLPGNNPAATEYFDPQVIKRRQEKEMLLDMQQTYRELFLMIVLVLIAAPYLLGHYFLHLESLGTALSVGLGFGTFAYFFRPARVIKNIYRAIRY